MTSNTAKPINPAKEYLMQIHKLDTRINLLLERRQRYMDMACKATSFIAADKVQTSGGRSRVESYACKLADLDREIDGEIDRLVDIKREAKVSIESICDQRYRDVLTYRYEDGMTWERIAEIMEYDGRHVRRLHGYALEAIKPHIKHALVCPP